MTNDTFFQIVFWVLLGGVLAMRVYFMRQVRRAGEQYRAYMQRMGRFFPRWS